MSSKNIREKLYGRVERHSIIIRKETRNFLEKQKLKHQIIEKLCEHQEKLLGKPKKYQRFTSSPNFVEETKTSSQKFRRIIGPIQSEIHGKKRSPSRSISTFRCTEDYLIMCNKNITKSSTSDIMATSEAKPSNQNELKSLNFLSSHGRLNSVFVKRMLDLLQIKETTKFRSN